MIDAVDHGGGLIEQHDFVDAFDLARVQHDLLCVAHLDALGLERQQHRRLTDIYTKRHVAHAVIVEHLLDFLSRTVHQAGRGRHGAAQTEHAGMAVIGR